MPRSHRSAPLAAVALGSLLLASCGTGGPPSRGDATNDIRNLLLARTDVDLDTDTAAAIADCVTDGLWDSGEFTTDERDDVIQATDGDEPDPELQAKFEDLFATCEEGTQGGEPQVSDDSEDSTTTTGG